MRNSLTWLVVGVLSFSLIGCSSQPVTPSYADIAAKYEALKTKPQERVIFDFEADCNDQGECIVLEQTLEDAAQVITRLNDAYDLAIQGSNQRLDALSSCEFANIQREQALIAEEKRYTRLEIGSTVKNLLTGAACAALLFAVP